MRLTARGLREAATQPRCGWWTASPQEILEKPLAGLQFVVTGRLAGLTRSQAEARIKELGGSVSSSVSRKTGYLVAGEDPGSKLEQARKLGTTLLDEAEFLQMIGEA